MTARAAPAATARGGEAFITAWSNPADGVEIPASSGTITGGDANVSASGFGGTGASGNGDNITPGAGGTGYGGTGCTECIASPGAYIQADGTATVSFTGSVGVLADGTGGLGGAGVNGQTGGLGGSGLRRLRRRPVHRQ